MLRTAPAATTKEPDLDEELRLALDELGTETTGFRADSANLAESAEQLTTEDTITE